MSAAARRAHWERGYYEGRDRGELFQERPAPSFELMAIGASGQSSVIDIGGGASRLVDCLIARGYEDVTVLDVSEGRSQLPRVLDKARQVKWVVADMTTWEPSRTYMFGNRSGG
jgi:trans-aconitate methyltransferase